MFGISWAAVVLLAIGVAAIAFAIFAPGRNDDEEEDERVEAVRPSAGEPAQGIRWPALIDGSQDDVPSTVRLRMIEGLGSLGEAWCGPILLAAYEEEEEGPVRDAVLAALRDANYHECEAVLASALASTRIEERVLAVELADAIDASEALDQALDDREVVVALAAAYALKHRLNGSFRAHLDQRVPRERAGELVRAISAFG